MSNCTKTRYVSEEAATEDIKRISKISKRSQVPNRVYFCKKCNSWHLTSVFNYKERIDELLLIVQKLTEENEKLKSQSFTAIDIKVRADKRVEKLNLKLKQSNKLVNSLRENIRYLFSSIRKLEGELKEK